MYSLLCSSPFVFDNATCLLLMGLNNIIYSSVNDFQSWLSWLDQIKIINPDKNQKLFNQLSTFVAIRHFTECFRHTWYCVIAFNTTSKLCIYRQENERWITLVNCWHYVNERCFEMMGKMFWYDCTLGTERLREFT